MPVLVCVVLALSASPLDAEPAFVLPDTVEVPLELFCTVELVVVAVLLLLMFTLLLLSKLILL